VRSRPTSFPFFFFFPPSFIPRQYTGHRVHGVSPPGLHCVCVFPPFFFFALCTLPFFQKGQNAPSYGTTQGDTTLAFFFPLSPTFAPRLPNSLGLRAANRPLRPDQFASDFPFPFPPSSAGPLTPVCDHFPPFRVLRL